MNQLRVRYHQLKIDMFALYQATMDSRGVKVHRVEQALGELPVVGDSSGVQLRGEDEAYVQALGELEKKITVGEHGRRRRHMLRKLTFSRPPGDEAAAVADVACSSEAAAAARHESGCRELDRHSSITVLRCYRCTKRFDSKGVLFQHWRDEINCHIVCLFCRDEFITNAKHDQHIRLCQALVCGQCKAQCSDYAGYEHHIGLCQFAAKCEPVEVLAARVQCPYCDRLFTQIHMFKRHLKIMHEVEHMQRFGLKIQRKFRPNEREFPCRQCGRTFNRVYNLKMHQLSHGRHGQYRCETCNKTFRFRSNLERHSRSHVAQQHVCRRCGEQFRLLRQLRSHMNLTHEKETFTCDVCQKSCEGYQRLLAHTRTHHSQKTYACGVCGRNFSIKHKYKEHMNVHECRYTYECHLCPDRFLTRDHLRKHYRKQHPDVKRLPRRATMRRPLEPARPQFFESTDLGPMINDTVTLYQASADQGESSVVKFEVVGESCEEPSPAAPPYAADQTSQEMMDGGYQVYPGSEQHVLGEYSTVDEAEAYGASAACARNLHPVQYYQQQVVDGMDGTATLLSLDPAPAGSVAGVPEGATVMTYIVPENSSSQFSVQDSGWPPAAASFGFTPEKVGRRLPEGVLFTPGQRPAASGHMTPSLFLTPDKLSGLTPHSLFMSPVRGGGGMLGPAATVPPDLASNHRSAQRILMVTPERQSAAAFASPLMSPPGARFLAPLSAGDASSLAAQGSVYAASPGRAGSGQTNAAAYPGRPNPWQGGQIKPEHSVGYPPLALVKAERHEMMGDQPGNAAGVGPASSLEPAPAYSHAMAESSVHLPRTSSLANPRGDDGTYHPGAVMDNGKLLEPASAVNPIATPPRPSAGAAAQGASSAAGGRAMIFTSPQQTPILVSMLTAGSKPV